MDFSKPSSSPLKNGAFLTQNKIPSDMIASYQPSGEFDPYMTDFQQMSYDQAQGMMSQYYQYQTSYYETYIDPLTPYSTKFPRASTYATQQTIVEAFPHLENVNDSNFDVESISPNAQFYILRSGNDDNIHKAIKYHIWATTANGKSVLKQAWQDFEQKGLTPEIYLVFSVVNSNQFLGIAKMTSNIINEESFKYWWEPCKWFGTFQLKWLFVKDIPHFKFEHIKENNNNTSIINSRDSTPISAESGKQIIKTFMENPSSPSIFESFEYMDRREDYIRAQRDNDTEFQQFFDSSCEAYKQDPEGFQPQRRPYHGRKTGRKPRSNFANKKYNNNNNNGNSNGNGNHYYAKTYYYKRNTNQNSNAVSAEANPESQQPVSLEEQFVVKTSNKKSSDFKSRRKYQPNSEPFHGNEEVNGRRFKENEKENVVEN
jgi:hypothetical protein